MTKTEIKAVKLRNFLDRNFSSSSERPYTSAIVTAAGSGTRMGGVSKPFYLLDGKPCILYSLLLFQKSPLIDEIIISSRPEEVQSMRDLCKKEKITKLSDVVPGGATRQESVRNAFQAIFSGSKILLIHDAARPLIRESDLELILKKVLRHGAACASNPVFDTVKKIGKKGMISETVPRDDLVTVQTPQAFFTDLYRVSLALAERDRIEVTDDCALAEHAGFSVYPCRTSRQNFKLTTLEDVPEIESILKGENR